MFHRLAEFGRYLSPLNAQAADNSIATSLGTLNLRLVGIARLRALLTLGIFLYVLNVVIVVSCRSLSDHAAALAWTATNNRTASHIGTTLLDRWELHVATDSCIFV